MLELSLGLDLIASSMDQFAGNKPIVAKLITLKSNEYCYLPHVVLYIGYGV